MIISIAADDYHRHWQDFRVVVLAIFPMLSYTPAQTEAFLNHWQTPREGQSLFLVETRSGQAFARCIGWDIQYLVPSGWDKRYDILREALEEVKADFLRSDGEKRSLGINDGFPSHTLFYVGMLPMLGFEIHSGEITFQAPDEFLDGLSLPALPFGVREMRYANVDHCRRRRFRSGLRPSETSHRMRMCGTPGLDWNSMAASSLRVTADAARNAGAISYPWKNLPRSRSSSDKAWAGTR